jgi:hypothetical protein
LIRAILLSGFLIAAAGIAQEPEPVYVFGTTVVIPSGLKGVIYHLSRFTKKLPSLDKEKPRGSIYTSSLNIPAQDYKQGFPGITKRLEWFAIDYTGRFWINEPGEYRFSLTSDDGSRLLIDHQEVIDNDGLHLPQTTTGKVELSGGIHTLEVPYFQGPKFAVALVLKIAGPGQDFRVFSTEEFKPPSNPETWSFPEKPAKLP